MKRKFKIHRFILAVFLISYFSYIFTIQEIEYKKYLNEKKSYIEQIEVAKHKTEEYRSYAEYVKSDAYIEKVAREKLSMVRPEEKIYIEINN